MTFLGRPKLFMGKIYLFSIFLEKELYFNLQLHKRYITLQYFNYIMNWLTIVVSKIH